MTAALLIVGVWMALVAGYGLSRDIRRGIEQLLWKRDEHRAIRQLRRNAMREDLEVAELDSIWDLPAFDPHEFA